MLHLLRQWVWTPSTQPEIREKKEIANKKKHKMLSEIWFKLVQQRVSGGRSEKV